MVILATENNFFILSDLDLESETIGKVGESQVSEVMSAEETASSRLCLDCKKYVPIHAWHCYICRSCFPDKKTHCCNSKNQLAYGIRNHGNFL